MSRSNVDRAFRYFRTRLVVTAVIVTVASGFALAAFLLFATPTPNFANNTYSGPLSPGLFTLFETLLSVVISIGTISLIYELFLRETYADDLSRFLNLKAAIVNSGRGRSRRRRRFRPLDGAGRRAGQPAAGQRPTRRALLTADR